VGKTDVAAYWRGWFAHHLGAQFKTEQMIVAGDRAIVRWVYHKMRHGQPWHLRGVDVFTVRRESGGQTRLREGIKVTLSPQPHLRHLITLFQIIR
jgi:ketosteroid isomerase-like protein